MTIREPFTDLEIKKAASGFYKDYSVPIALVSIPQWRHFVGHAVWNWADCR